MISYRMSTKEKWITFTVRGHAGYAEHGKDIVCAAVSAIASTAAAGARMYDSQAGVEYGGGFICVHCRDKPIVRAIIKTAVCGLDAVKAQYRDYFEG